MNIHPNISHPKKVRAFKRFLDYYNSVLKSEIVLINSEIYYADDIPNKFYCNHCESEITRTTKSFYKTPHCYCKNIKKSGKGVRKSTETFTEELVNIHPNLILKSEYVNKYTPVSVLCTQCKSLEDYIPHNLINGQNCKICKCSTNKGQVSYKESIDKLGDNFYIPKKFYRGWTIKTLIYFKNCSHTSYKSPKDVYDYGRCNVCDRHVNWDEPTVLYTFKVELDECYAYKIGISRGGVLFRYNRVDLSRISNPYQKRCL